MSDRIRALQKANEYLQDRNQELNANYIEAIEVVKMLLDIGSGDLDGGIEKIDRAESMLERHKASTRKTPWPDDLNDRLTDD